MILNKLQGVGIIESFKMISGRYYIFRLYSVISALFVEPRG